MLDHNFTGTPFTLGIEEELMLCDAETLELAQAIEAILDAIPEDVHGHVKPELMQSVLEIATAALPRRRRGRRASCGSCAAWCADVAERSWAW